MLALWLFATLEGVGSARRLAELCERDNAYRWLCGGVRVNYHGLSDFRSGHGELPDGLLSEQVAALPGSGMASLDEVAVDGTKVRASAGSGSFRGAAVLIMAVGTPSQGRPRPIRRIASGQNENC